MTGDRWHVIGYMWHVTRPSQSTICFSNICVCLCLCVCVIAKTPSWSLLVKGCIANFCLQLTVFLFFSCFNYFFHCLTFMFDSWPPRLSECHKPCKPGLFKSLVYYKDILMILVISFQLCHLRCFVSNLVMPTINHFLGILPHYNLVCVNKKLKFSKSGLPTLCRKWGS